MAENVKELAVILFPDHKDHTFQILTKGDEAYRTCDCGETLLIGTFPQEEPDQEKGAIKPLIDDLLGSIDSTDMSDSSKMGSIFGNLFSKVSTAISKPRGENETGEEYVESFMVRMFGDEMASQMKQAREVKSFFANTLVGGASFKDSMLLTKKKFDLPDGYKIEVKFTINFTGEVSNIPEVD